MLLPPYSAGNAPSDPGRIQVTLEAGLGERRLVAVPGDIVRLVQDVKPGLVVIAGNARGEPPFATGSAVLRQLRAAELVPAAGAWRRVLAADRVAEDLAGTVGLDLAKAGGQEGLPWAGVWLGESPGRGQPDVLLLNLPLWALKYSVRGDPGGARGRWEAALSGCYRLCLAGLEAVRAFRSGAVDWRRVVFSDLGGAMTIEVASGEARPAFQASRVRVLAEVLGAWVARSAGTEEVHVAFGEDRERSTLREAWEVFAQEGERGREDAPEFGVLRRRNAEACRGLAHRLASEATLARHRGVVSVLESAGAVFAGPVIVLSELTQGRMVAEALAGYLAIESGAVSRWEGTLERYIEKAAETGRFSQWLMSYLHLLRVLGNNAVHIKEIHRRRPEQPVVRDLHAFHAVLDRVLDFAAGEMGVTTGAFPDDGRR
jgi:hypothetical protein